MDEFLHFNNCLTPAPSQFITQGNGERAGIKIGLRFCEKEIFREKGIG
jgi:hypothetical protein